MTKYNNSGDKDSDRNRVYLCFDNDVENDEVENDDGGDDVEMMKLIVKMMVEIKVKMRVKWEWNESENKGDGESKNDDVENESEN